MTNDIKYSWFLAQKGTNKAKRIKKKYLKKWSNVYSIRENSDIYGIELSQVSKNMIDEKKVFYSKQINKLSWFITYFESSGKDKALENIKKYYTKSEIQESKNIGWGVRIMKKIF